MDPIKKARELLSSWTGNLSKKTTFFPNAKSPNLRGGTPINWGQVVKTASQPRPSILPTPRTIQPVLNRASQVVNSANKPRASILPTPQITRNIGQNLSKTLIYNPETKRALPNSIAWNIQDLNKRSSDLLKGKITRDQFFAQAGDDALIFGGFSGGVSKTLKGGKLSQQAIEATKKLDLQVPKTGDLKASRSGRVNTQKDLLTSPSLTDDTTDPVQKIIQALQEAKPIRGQQEKLYSAERAKRIAKVAGVGSRVPGEQGYFAQLGQLKGELPKVQFEGIRKQVGQADIDSLFNKVEQSNISPFEKVTAKGGLAKLLRAEGGAVPNRSELELLNEIFPPEFMEAVLSKRSRIDKLLGFATEAINLPRAVMSTLDLSAPLRQGIFLVGRPKQFAPAFKEMFKYAASEKAYQGFQESIRSRPTYQLMRQSKLALTDTKSVLNSREEAFMSNLAEKIPGFGVLAKGSNRAYSGFLTKLRADVFDDLVKTAKSQGIEVEGKTLDDIAKFVNSATGRGDIGALNRAAPLLNGVFFSPRLMMSRVNLLNPKYYVDLDPFVRKEALKSLLTFGTTAGTVLALAKLGGAEVGNDPRSADFGKIKIGNTRYDTLGGFQQYIKLAAQLMTGKVVSSTTGKVITLGEGYKPLTRKDILMRFFESKEAPVASFITSLLTGQTAVGEPVDIPTELISRFIPMMVQDMYEIARDKDSVGQGLVMALPGIFGVGSQTYGKTELVKGENALGDPTAQVRPVQGLAETLSEKVFGQRTLGSSSTSNVESYYDQMSKLPKQDAAKQFEDIKKTNPDLAKKIVDIAKERKLGVTVEDKTLKGLGVASGERAKSVVQELQKLNTDTEKAGLWEHYVEIGVITPEVSKQIKKLLDTSKKKSDAGFSVVKKAKAAEAPKSPFPVAYVSDGNKTTIKYANGLQTKIATSELPRYKRIITKAQEKYNEKLNSQVETAEVKKPSGNIGDLVTKYFPKNQYNNALKVIGAESSGRPDAINVNRNGSKDYGLLQINDMHAKRIKEKFGYDMEDLLDPEKNLEVARWLWNESGWKIWYGARKAGVR